MNQALQQRRQQTLFREAKVTKRLSPTLIEIDGRTLVNFGANDYLGMSWSLAEHLVNQYSPTIGSGAAPLLSGYSEHHAALESSLAKFEGSEAAIVFSTGYAANVGTISAVAQEGDLLLGDSLNHASLIDGCRLSKAKSIVYSHSDMQAVHEILSQHRSQFKRCYLATDTLFSMNGDLAKLPEIVALAKKFEMSVIVDEAHATGIYGKNGRGWVEECGLENQIAIRIGTLSKAIGSVGGFVHGSRVLIDYLRNFARTYIYSTSMPEWIAIATKTNLTRLTSMSRERTDLRRMSSDLRNRLQLAGFQVPSEDSPIIPIRMESPEIAVDRSYRLRELGFYVPAIRPPTVPADQSMLRVSLCIDHTEEQIKSLINSLSQNAAGVAQATR